MTANRKRCCVVGSGISGLATIKECLTQGLDTTCYETGDDIAGLWKYRPEVVPGQASLYDSLHLNSSREMSCFSDFSFPPSVPNFMHHSYFNQYIRKYAEHFGLRDHILFRTEVQSIVQASDFEATGQWLVTTKKVGSDVPSTEMFDFVVVCHGHDFMPNVPNFSGLEDFSGDVIHSHNYKNVSDFQDRRVLVVGFGHSGAEIASQLAKHAEQVYLSTRSGTYITTKSTQDGRPYDQALYTRFRTSLPYQVRRYLEYKNLRFQNQFGIQPKTPFKPGVLTISNDFLDEMVYGRIIVKDNIDFLKQDSIVFKDQSEEKIDTVILATGFKPDFSMLPDMKLRSPDNVVPNLYKLVFPTTLDPCTLAFVGMLYSIGSRTPTVELQARWVTQVFSGKLPTPPVGQRIAWLNKRKQELYSLPMPTEKKALCVSYVPYLKDIAAEAKCNPNLWRVLFTDPLLWFKMVFKPLTPPQWRLHGPKALPEYARMSILKLQERNLFPYKVASSGTACVRERSAAREVTEDGTQQEHVTRMSYNGSKPQSGFRQSLALFSRTRGPGEKKRETATHSNNGNKLPKVALSSRIKPPMLRLVDISKRFIRMLGK